MNKKALSGGIIALIVVGVFILLTFILIGGIASSYNNLVDKDVSVEAQWGKVQSSYERRLDLLPNLARTVKGSSDFEKETLVEVAKARGGIRVANNPSELEEANRPISALIAGMMTYTEQYPEIKSTELYVGLMDELAGTENRIKFERDNYNDLVRDYKQTVRSFPSSIFAGMFGFEASKWDMFEANKDASIAPTIDFSDK